MKTFKIYFVILSVFMGMFYSCETTEMELLNDPNQLSDNQADPNLLLNSIQLNYLSSISTFNDRSAELARIDYMFGRNYLDNFNSGVMENPWFNLYADMMPDIDLLESLNSDTNDLSYHLGISKVMQAHVTMLLVDFVGDIPFSEATDPLEFPSPMLDDDASVYDEVENLLDEAETLLTGSSPGGANDLFFAGGSTSKWIKVINTLRMRINLTIGNYLAVVNATNVIENVSDDFEFKYGTNQNAPDTRHPDYAGDYASTGAGGYRSNWLMDLMVGPFGDFSSTTDPRRRYYFYRQAWSTPGSYALFQDTNGQIGPAGGSYFLNVEGNAETLSCSIETVPNHLAFTPDEFRWCSLRLGYWGRIHGDDDGTPPDTFRRTAVGVYPAGGSFDGVRDNFPWTGNVISAEGISNFCNSNFPQHVALGAGGAGAGIEPIYLSSYVDFMKAEAALHLDPTDGNSAARNFLRRGITKSISKVMSFGSLDGSANPAVIPSAAAVTNFINSRVSEFASASASTLLDPHGFPINKDKMDILGEQYFIALYGGASDAFNFIRRTGYPRTLARSLEENPGLFPRTTLYPSSEVSTNPNVEQRLDNSTKVFWDLGTTNPAN